MTIARAAVHEHLSTLADPTRGRILLVLQRNELTVGELCTVLQLPQSTASRHLRVLSDEGWVVSRQEGTSRFYAANSALEGGASRLWHVVSADLEESHAGKNDRLRMATVIERRSEKSRAYFSASAAEWDRVRDEMFGVGDLAALAGLLDEGSTVADLGCGTGRMTAMLAPHVKRVVAVDGSATMLEAARVRLSPARNVEFHLGDIETLPLAPASIDVAVLSLVLHHTADPLRAFLEMHRVLRSGARLLVVDMVPHERTEYRQKMGHVWLGFAEAQVRAWLGESGFEAVRHWLLPGDPHSHGPPLFAAIARRGATPPRVVPANMKG